MAAIGILGGTFDPVHNAHLAMARAALAALKLDKILFIPTGNPRYRKPAVVSDTHRLAMLALALEDRRQFAVDARELAPGASGYTVDTLRELHAEGKKDLWLLLGADQYASLASWHRPEEVAKLAKIAVFPRPGTHLKENLKLIPIEPMPISSTELRARAARGEDLSPFVPPAVAAYIARHGLYRRPPA